MQPDTVYSSWYEYRISFTYYAIEMCEVIQRGLQLELAGSTLLNIAQWNGVLKYGHPQEVVRYSNDCNAIENQYTEILSKLYNECWLMQRDIL
jgi:hypothetical protein